MLNYYFAGYIILIPAILLTIYASYKVKSTFNKFAKINNSRNITGAEVAKIILNNNSLDLPINRSHGVLSDHYDPIKKTLALSPDVYDGTSISALAVAAHEVGHALQHAASYKFLSLRTYMYPVVGFSTWLAPILIMAGFFLSSNLLWAGIIFYSVATLFTVITLPVEFDASRRAMQQITNLGLVVQDESEMAKKVLSAAALTYVASALTAILELIRLILIANDR